MVLSLSRLFSNVRYNLNLRVLYTYCTVSVDVCTGKRESKMCLISSDATYFLHDAFI